MVLCADFDKSVLLCIFTNLRQTNNFYAGMESVLLRFISISDTAFIGDYFLRTTMRTEPTLVSSGTFKVRLGGNDRALTSGPSINRATKDNVQIVSEIADNNEDELFTDNIIEDLIPDKKGKKKKKNKDKPSEDNTVKKPRKPNKCIYFRTHPENKQLIDEKAEENDPENPNKKLGKVKAGCTLWNALSTPEKEEWGERCMADNTD